MENDVFVIKDGVLRIYNGNEKDVVIPSGVARISDGAFAGVEEVKRFAKFYADGMILKSECPEWALTSMEDVTKPAAEDGTKSPGWAYDRCERYTTPESVVIPEGVTEIGDEAFRGCRALKAVSIPKSVKRIGGGVFAGCASLTSVEYAGTMEEWKCMEGNENILATRDVRCTDGVLEKPAVKHEGEFRCLDRNATDVTIPNGVKKIGERAFLGCTALESVVIPEGVTEIGDWAFARCSSLTSIVIPNGVTKIGETAFEGCTSLESISISASVKELSIGVFYDCTSLKEIRYGGTKSQWLFMLGGLNLVSHVRVAVICSDCDARSLRRDLLRCKEITEISIPGNIVRIAPRAFSRFPSLTSVKIPGSVVMICDEAFAGCASLTAVEYADTMAEWECLVGKENVPAAEVKCTDGMWKQH